MLVRVLTILFVIINVGTFVIVNVYEKNWIQTM